MSFVPVLCKDWKFPHVDGEDKSRHNEDYIVMALVY
jgi:hypothetical protein